MANTPNLNLPLIDASATADVPRDMNALANAVDTNVKTALESVTVPDASLTQKGIVQLSNATNGTRENVAPTEKAVGIVQNNLSAHSADNTSHVKYGVDTGTANAKAVTLTPAPSVYVDGMAVAFKNSIQNTGAVTININGLGAKTVLKANGNALSSGNLKANSIYTLRYNGTSFILQGEGGGGTAQPSDVIAGMTFTNDDGEQVGVLVPGRKVATGTATFTQKSPSVYELNITGIGFNPNFAYLISNDSTYVLLSNDRNKYPFSNIAKYQTSTSTIISKTFINGLQLSIDNTSAGWQYTYILVE